jgi:nucleoside-diphosphate-sugar epimerase
MTEIICGIGGFVGSNLRKYLEDKGKTVIALPVEMLLDPPNMHLFLKEHEPYNLYFLAAFGNLHFQTDVHETFEVNVIKLLNLLEATKETNINSILVAGSTSEYGNKIKPMTEDMVLEPETFYGASKAAATHLCQVWAKVFDSPIVVFRPASITGVGEQDIHLIPTLIRSCVLQTPMPFIADSMHDYINVLDICSALEILSEHAKEHKGEIFNVGTGTQTNNSVIKEMVEEITKKRANINIAVKMDAKTITRNFSQMWQADSTKLRKLGWRPTKTLYQSLKDMVRSM